MWGFTVLCYLCANEIILDNRYLMLVRNFSHGPFRKKKAQHYKLQAAVHSCQDAIAEGSEVLKHPSHSSSNVKPATESDYSYAAVQGISEQLEQVDANEATYAEIKENELYPCQLPTASKEAPPELTEANNDHMYAAVAKKKKMPSTASEDMPKPALAGEISVLPAKPAPYKGMI